MQLHFVLIDYENVHVKSLALLKGEQFHVRIFLGKSNTKIHSELAIAMQKLGNRGDYIMLESSGSNALDFHIAYYLGVLASANPVANFHIISKDTGFDPLVAHLTSRSIEASRSISIEAMPCFDVLPGTALEQPGVPPPARKTGTSRSTKSPVKRNKMSAALETQIQAMIENLNNRRSARPTKMATLLNTIHAKIGKSRPVEEAEALRDVLVDRGYVMVDGTRVSYNPAALE